MMMKSMKRAALLLTAGTIAAVMPAMMHAQDPAAPPAGQQQGGGYGGGGRGGRGMMDPDQRLAMLDQQLTLTADQKASIKPILVDSQKKMMDLRNNSSLSRDDLRTQMMAIRTDQDTRIKAVLTADQKTKYDAMPRPGRPGGGGGPQN
jgi:periplasmic protein CpxP/Spy